MEASQLWHKAQREIAKSNVDSRHPFRKLQLATVGDFPQVRTVINRGFNNLRQCYIYADTRSPKMDEIWKNPKVSILLYDPREKLQVRMQGYSKIITSGTEYEEHLSRVKRTSDYTTSLAPGTKLDATLRHGETIYFGLIKISPEKWDILQLGSDEHHRAVYHPYGDDWRGELVVP